MASEPERPGPGGLLPDGTIRVVHETDTITALDLHGEFDLSSSPQIIEQVGRALDNGQDLIINLSLATFIDSSVVHALFKADAAAKAQGRRFVLELGTESAVERVLAIVGADKELATAPSREESINVIHQHTKRRPKTPRREGPAS